MPSPPRLIVDLNEADFRTSGRAENCQMGWAAEKVLRALCLALCIMALPLAAAGQEDPPRRSTPTVPPSANDVEEQTFRDPFAAESEAAKPAAKATSTTR